MTASNLAHRIHRSASGRALLAFFAVVVMWQGLSVGVVAVRGPAHTHGAPVLQDFRRGPVAVTESVARPGPFVHSHDIAMRHHHGAADPTVVLDAGEHAADAAADEASLTLELAIAAFVALVVTFALGVFNRSTLARAMRAGWTWSVGFNARLERPPQAA